MKSNERRRRRFVRIYRGGLKSSDSDTLLSLRLEIDRSKPKPTSQIGGSPLLVHRADEEANESRGIIAFKIRLRHLFSDSRRLVGNFIKGFNWLYIRPVKYESVPREIRPDWIERLSRHRLLSTYTHSLPPNFLLLSESRLRNLVSIPWIIACSNFLHLSPPLSLRITSCFSNICSFYNLFSHVLNDHCSRKLWRDLPWTPSRLIEQSSASSTERQTIVLVISI